MPFNVGKVGQVAASRHPILVEDVAVQNDWVVRPEWAKREKIQSFAGHPLIFRDKLLGVIAVFSRQHLGPQEFSWLGLFANQAALAISNACAEQALQSTDRNLAAIIDTIPTLAWCNLPDGPNEFLNRGWHEYTGLTPEESHGWGWQAAFHPEDLPPLMEKWRHMLVSGESDEIEARLRRHDGVYRWFLIRAQALRNDAGQIVRWYGTSTDIEERKQAEEARRASERNLAAIINTIPTTAWTARPDGYCDFLNQVWLDYAGMSANQAQGWGWANAIHPDDRKALVEQWQSSLASGIPVDTEARLRRFDASYRWFLIRANPLKDEAGAILKWYGTCIDIEDHKRGEQDLRARELSWRQIVDNVPGHVATTGAMGEVEFLNRQTLEYFGKTSEELKDWALIGAVHPDDLPRVIEARKKSIEEGQIYEIEHRCRRADGVYRWFQVRGLPVRTTENHITAWYLLLTDIDDRKKAEEALQSSERNLSLLINTIPTFIGVLLTDGTLAYVNQTVLDYTGRTLEDVQKKDFPFRIFHPDDVARVREERRDALKYPVPFENEQRVLGKDGRYRWFLIRYSPLLDEYGRIDRWYVAATDIEDQKRAEHVRLEERTRIARELHDSLLQTVQSASLHLAAALYGATIDSPVRARLERSLQLMSQGIEEGRDTIRGLRSSDAHAMDLVVALSDVQRELPGQPDVDFRVSVTGRQQPLNPSVTQEMYRIGREALLNAFRHSSAKRVDIGLEYVDHGLQMRVRDDGIGIDPQVLREGRAGHFGFAGMRERAARIGGVLNISSGSSGGTEVQLWIPNDLAFQPSTTAGG